MGFLETMFTPLVLLFACVGLGITVVAIGLIGVEEIGKLDIGVSLDELTGNFLIRVDDVF
ncbi:MAG TPA: hypothetical protein GX717_04505 [Clostridiaceae bacterium]|nr:hypothetical protein [Clostridiaceae bacterium]